MIDAQVIDRQGIVGAIQLAMDTALQALLAQCEHDIAVDDALVLLDGGLHAPERFVHQHTIIRGDENEPAIALASIAAKETRDAHMDALALQHPQYGFDAHKGYGTKRHIEALKAHGLSHLHRASFCGAFV
jgi:ribonuclease HII